VAVVASHRREFDGIVRIAGSGSALDLPLDFARSVTWELPGKGPVDWWLLAAGVGAAAAARACSVIPHPARLDAIWSIGYCGATQPGFRAGDLLAAAEVRSAATGRCFPCLTPSVPAGSVAKGVVLTVDHIVRFASEKHHIGQQGVDAVEMEASAVAAFAASHQAPFLALKAVSDTYEEEIPIDFDRARLADGRMSARSILAQTLRRPWATVPGLRNLARSARLASESIGQAMVGISW
jgi:nucleoside phosphorylase